MSLLFIFVAWYICGYIGLCIVERIDKTEHPIIAIMTGPFTFLVALVFLIHSKSSENKPPSKLRRWIRGF